MPHQPNAVATAAASHLIMFRLIRFVYARTRACQCESMLNGGGGACSEFRSVHLAGNRRALCRKHHLHMGPEYHQPHSHSSIPFPEHDGVFEHKHDENQPGEK